MVLLGILISLIFFLAGPLVGLLIANYRGLNPFLGLLLGLFHLLGWVILFLIPAPVDEE